MFGNIRRGLICSLLVLVGVLETRPATAINIVLDYSYDSSNFFGSGNPDGAAAGAQARATMEFTADFFSDMLADTFSAIETPPTYFSQAFNGSVSWDWTLNFNNPSSNSLVTLQNQTIAADEYRVYVGGRSIPGSTIGVGGPGGWGWSSSPSGGFSSAEINQINQISDDFGDAVTTRGESSGFANWGGAVTFDTDASADWHYDYASPPSSGKNDFFSTAIHELAHAVGFGTSDEWNALVSAGAFRGTKAMAEHSGPIPTIGGHWAPNTDSVVLGTNIVQQSAMEPSSFSGTRQRFTALDAAALDDIGWDIEVPIVYASADYDTDGDVDNADRMILENWYGVSDLGDADGDGDTDGSDLLVWQQQFTGPQTIVANVPEPSTIALCSAALLLWLRRRR